MPDEPTKVEPAKPPLHCSFCRKSQKEVKGLIAGPDAYICNECVALCNDILGESAPAPSEQPAHEERSEDAQAVLAFGEGLYVLYALVASASPNAVEKLQAMRQAMENLRAADQAGRIHWTPISEVDMERIERITQAIASGESQTATALAEEYLVASFGPDWVHAFGAGYPWPVLPLLSPEVIAESEVERLADEEGEGGKGKIIIYKPVAIGEKKWVCEYQVTVPGHEERKIKAHGVDSAQALRGALHVLSASLSHEPVICQDGYHAWEPYHDPTYDHEPMPMFIKRLRAYGTDTPWLVDLNAGIAALQQIGRWIQAGKEIDRGGMEALDRGLRYLQAAKGNVDFPDVQDADIGRLSEIRRMFEPYADAQPPAELQARIDEALRSWTRMVRAIRDND